MDALADPWLGFWAPLGLLCLSTGFWLTDRKDGRQRLVKPLAGLCLVVLIAFAVTTRGDDGAETALLAALFHMAGPAALMGIGCLVAVFAGPSPVEPIPRSLRPVGFLMAFAGLAWIGWMLVSEPPAATAHGIGETIWGAWVLTFVCILILVAATAGAFCVMMGEQRHKEALTLAGLTIGGGATFVHLMSNGSVGLAASGWQRIHWQEITFLSGGLTGMALAGLALIVLVYMAEKRAPDPDVVAPLTEREKAVVEAVLRTHLHGGEEE